MDDSVLDEIEGSEIENKVVPLTLLNTNARSLCPKIESLIDCMEEMDAAIAVVTETWLADGPSLESDIADLTAGAGIGLVCRNRRPNLQGVAHGGVAVAFKTELCAMKEVQLHNPEDFEILVTAASLPGYSRKFITVACYLPPNYTVGRGRAALAHIEDVIIEIKRRYRDPFLYIGGDFNQWDIKSIIDEFPDLRESAIGPTRKDRCLDRIFTNFGRAEKESGTVEPLEAEEGAAGTVSDHRVAFVRAELPRLRSFEWTSHQYRFYNQESVDKFGSWLAGFDWAPLVQMSSSNEKAEFYQAQVTGALERYFPLVRVRRKTSDCPWISARIRKMIKNRKGIYSREGRSKKWRRLRKVINDLIYKRKEAYLESQRSVLLVEDARRNFFRNIKAFKSKDRPKAFDVRTLFPGKSDGEIADELAGFFNRISHEFEPLEPCDVPRTFDTGLPALEPFQVAGRIRAFKKPKSMVNGDIFPALVHKFATLLAVPLTSIYNTIY